MEIAGLQVISHLYMGYLGNIWRQYACYLLLQLISSDYGGYMQAICWPFAANLHFTSYLLLVYKPHCFNSTHNPCLILAYKKLLEGSVAFPGLDWGAARSKRR